MSASNSQHRTTDEKSPLASAPANRRESYKGGQVAEKVAANAGGRNGARDSEVGSWSTN